MIVDAKPTDDKINNDYYVDWCLEQYQEQEPSPTPIYDPFPFYPGYPTPAVDPIYNYSDPSNEPDYYFPSNEFNMEDYFKK